MVDEGDQVDDADEGMVDDEDMMMLMTLPH